MEASIMKTDLRSLLTGALAVTTGAATAAADR
jgi:hypothetical protein